MTKIPILKLPRPDIPEKKPIFYDNPNYNFKRLDKFLGKQIKKLEKMKWDTKPAKPKAAFSL